jgi:hypothetical protein
MIQDLSGDCGCGQAEKELANGKTIGPQSMHEETSPPETPIAAYQGNCHRVPTLKLQGDVPVSLLDADNTWGAAPSAEVRACKVVISLFWFLVIWSNSG